MEHKFTTYIRTKMLFQQRLRYLTDYSVSVHESDLKRFNMDNILLHQLINKGEISYLNERFEALQSGAVDLSLLKRKQGAKQTPLHEWMKQCLLFVGLSKNVQPTDYFNAFLKTRKQYLDLFFTVDVFSGRTHTPVSSLHRTLRPFLTLCNDPITSLDIGQMQPLLLAKVLFDNIGNNTFSSDIFDGKDIYSMLQSKAGLNDREEAKKRFFEIAFSQPNDYLERLFGAENWITWINEYKRKYEPRNPHSEKRHSNLAWLLQSYEVRIMSTIWQKLAENAIPFLSVHDEIICRVLDAGEVEKYMNNELVKHFKNYKINVK